MLRICLQQMTLSVATTRASVRPVWQSTPFIFVRQDIPRTAMTLSVTCSVPQGSGLGPLVFILDMADIADRVAKNGVGVCVVTGTRKFDRGLDQILHDELHWLDVPDRVFFKLAVLFYRCLNGRASPYLSDYCDLVASAVTRRRRRRPANRQLLGSQHLWPPCLFNCRPHIPYLSALEIKTFIKRLLLRYFTVRDPTISAESDICLKRICSLDTRSSWRLLRYINPLTSSLFVSFAVLDAQCHICY